MPNTNGSGRLSQGRNVFIGHLDLIRITIPCTRHNQYLWRNNSDLYYWTNLARRLAESLPHASFGGIYLSRNCRRTCCRICLDQLAARMTCYGPRRIYNTLMSIMISHTNRFRIRAYHRAVELLAVSLNHLDVDYFVSWAELAIDTPNEEVGRWLHHHVSMKYANLANMFHFPYCSEKIDGGSPDANHEYIHGRKGRRSLHKYCRPEEGIWRTELILRRGYFRSRGIHTIPDLFQEARGLIFRNLKFKRLDMRKLRTECSSSRNWGLRNMSPDGQLRIITERLGCDRKFAGRYFEVVPRPRINTRAFRLVFDHSINQ